MQLTDEVGRDSGRYRGGRAGQAAVRRLFKRLFAGAKKGGRDAVVRGIAHNPTWFTLLPCAIWPCDEFEAAVVSPAMYVNMAIDGTKPENGTVILVDGSVRLVQSGEGVYLDGVRFSPGGSIFDLPRAIVKGNLALDGLTDLKSAELFVTGSVKLSGLENLRTLRGEVFGGVTLRETGLEKIGADFRCAGTLAIFHHRRLRSVNCEVGGDLTVIPGGRCGAGPALSVGGQMRVSEFGGRQGGKTGREAP